jgi:hypothetical protein
MNGREESSSVCLGYEVEEVDNTKDVIHKFGGLVSPHISYQQNITREHIEEQDVDRKILLNWILLNKYGVWSGLN